MVRCVDPSVAARTLTCRLTRAGTMTCNETSLLPLDRDDGVAFREVAIARKGKQYIMILANHDVKQKVE